ncbi:hypothetical protein Vadar_010967 [Vaccinium darrowii]|uniref:Uncharacterized protein n=1 Tax=Vaccinium darrowii TaxID=229202 RepID=A0ACB7XY91_9ERIC|nr:hypothetical protein Vadar_010967 [Vaccinium darrowii]
MRHGGGGVNCQDCGNQAKKDCVHFRCRTCCKSRGLPCQTHVKSTWVPAARRRERQQLQDQQQQHQSNQQQQLNLMMRGGGEQNNPTKRMRENTRLPTTLSGFEVANFPPEVNSQAIFRCVRVSPMDDVNDQYAYQTAVNIGGHVFKGILYDQGPDSRYTGGGESSSGGASGSSQLPLNLIAGATTTTTATMPSAATTGNMAVTMVDPSLYSTPLCAFLAGTQFFPPPRP